MSLYDELMEVYDHRGMINGRLVVDEWRPEDHPSHGRLEWDDQIAGERYRIGQAEGLIRIARISIEVEQKNGRRKIRNQRVFIATGTVGAGSEYHLAEEVVKDPVKYQLALSRLTVQAKALRREFSELQEYERIVREHALGQPVMAEH